MFKFEVRRVDEEPKIHAELVLSVEGDLFLVLTRETGYCERVFSISHKDGTPTVYETSIRDVLGIDQD